MAFYRAASLVWRRDRGSSFPMDEMLVCADGRDSQFAAESGAAQKRAIHPNS